jgi:glycosyltransferase involved in cell wall biosynthesis
VIVSKFAGVSEVVENGVNGLVVNCGQPEEIAKHVEFLMNNPDLRREMGKRAYEYVKTNLSWEKYAQRVEKVFQETLHQTKN